MAEQVTMGRWPESKRPMSFGIMLPVGEGSTFGDPAPTFAEMLEMVRAADAAGFEFAWLADHFHVPPAPGFDRERHTWEAMAMMAGLAAATRDLAIQYGPLVACTSFRSPGTLANMAEAIDEISGGKFVLGLGAGWHKPEYDAYGYPFDHRVSRFEEAITIIASLLREGRSTFSGTYYQTREAELKPRGPRAASGGAPIMVGSSGDRMLGILAKHADAWNTSWLHELDDIKPLIAKMEAAMEKAGRDPQTVVRTIGTNIGLDGATGRRGAMLTGSEDEITARILEIRELGFAHMIVGLDPCTPETLARFGEIIAKVDAA